MLTQLSTVKARLAIPELDVQYDALLAMTIRAVSARFDQHCHRTFARAVNATHEFSGGDTEISVPCYPIEAVHKFELKENESDGWLEQAGVRFLLRAGCVISLCAALSAAPAALARVTYTGGYVLPGASPEPGQAALPDDLEQATVEQVAYWFQNRERLGLVRLWEYHGTYRQFGDLDLLTSVQGVLRHYERWTL